LRGIEGNLTGDDESRAAGGGEEGGGCGRSTGAAAHLAAGGFAVVGPKKLSLVCHRRPTQGPN